jgi:Ca-activated chloride channel family protein
MTLLQFNGLKFNFVQLLILRRLGAFLLSILLPIITIAPLQAKTVDRSQNSICRGNLNNNLEAPETTLENQQFSTTTTMSAHVVFSPVPLAGISSPVTSVGSQTFKSVNPIPMAGRVRLNPSLLLEKTRWEQRLASQPNPNDRLAPIRQPGNTESYSAIDEAPFQSPSKTPLSTFSIDVDTASYSNARRMITNGQIPHKDSIRIEELLNYFSYGYPQPENNAPFSVNTDVTQAPWNLQHKLVRIGLKGKQLQEVPPSNLVFLIDVSGSMNSPNRLPLVQRSLCLLTQQLTNNDRVTLVVYAGNAGMVLPPTSGDRKAEIFDAIDRLRAGGSTAGGAGIELAYKEAQKSFIKGGNNRVILATDGDFNVGASSDAEMIRLIESHRDKGIFLTVLGFGMNNYKDSKLEQLADRGNGNYAYIDTYNEAKKVLGTDLRGTLFTIAKDVKIQVEFNPNNVQAYRLIGYENRALKDQDFNDDRKDAGEIGAGHSVTALYEIIPPGITPNVKLSTVDDLKYQTPKAATTFSNSNELMQVKLRYKQPTGDTSALISQTIANQMTPIDHASMDTKFASAVAMFGLLLRDSEYKGTVSIQEILKLAKQSKGADSEGYRQEFIQLVERYNTIPVVNTRRDR